MQEALCFLSCGYGLETTHVTNTNLFRAAKRQSTSAVGGARSVVMKTVRWVAVVCTKSIGVALN